MNDIECGRCGSTTVRDQTCPSCTDSDGNARPIPLNTVPTE